MSNNALTDWEREALQDAADCDGYEAHQNEWSALVGLETDGLLALSAPRGPDDSWRRVTLTLAGHLALRMGLRNALQIAEAAPDLLAALRGLLAGLPPFNADHHPVLADDVARARAAIAKAEGAAK